MKMKKIDYDEYNEHILRIGNIIIIMPKHGENGDLYDVAFNFLSMWIKSRYECFKDEFELDKFKQIIFDSIIESSEDAFNNAIEVFKNEEDK